MKRLQVLLVDEAQHLVESISSEASNNFEMGSISYSDVINEMILTSNVDIKALQTKHINIRRALRKIATREDLDIESAIKSLMEIKSKPRTRKSPEREERTES